MDQRFNEGFPRIHQPQDDSLEIPTSPSHDSEKPALHIDLPNFVTAPVGTRFLVKALDGKVYEFLALNTNTYRYRVQIDGKRLTQGEDLATLQRVNTSEGSGVAIWIPGKERLSTGPIEEITMKKSSTRPS